MAKYTKLLQFNKKTALRIKERDGGCYFCRQLYHMKCTNPMLYEIQDIMHVVNKSALGLGIEQNGVLGCRYHHSLLDNGNKGLRSEMLDMMEDYLKTIYPGWEKNKLVYKNYNLVV